MLLTDDTSSLVEFGWVVGLVRQVEPPVIRGLAAAVAGKLDGAIVSVDKALLFLGMEAINTSTAAATRITWLERVRVC